MPSLMAKSLETIALVVPESGRHENERGLPLSVMMLMFRRGVGLLSVTLSILLVSLLKNALVHWSLVNLILSMIISLSTRGMCPWRDRSFQYFAQSLSLILPGLPPPAGLSLLYRVSWDGLVLAGRCCSGSSSG